jgi:hypothetical protein
LNPVSDGDNASKFFQPPPHVSAALASWKHHPAYLAIAAIDLAKIYYAISKTPAQKRPVPEEQLFLKALRRHGYDRASEPEFLNLFRTRRNDPDIRDIISQISGPPADVNHSHKVSNIKGRIKIERSAPPQRLIPALSRAMVSYFRKQPAHKKAVALITRLMGDKIPKRMTWQVDGANGDKVNAGSIKRHDLKRVLLTYKLADWKQVIERLKRPSVAPVSTEQDGLHTPLADNFEREGDYDPDAHADEIDERLGFKKPTAAQSQTKRSRRRV